MTVNHDRPTRAAVLLIGGAGLSAHLLLVTISATSIRVHYYCCYCCCHYMYSQALY